MSGTGYGQPGGFGELHGNANPKIQICAMRILSWTNAFHPQNEGAAACRDK